MYLVTTFSCADKAFQESCKSQAPHLPNDTLPQHSALEHVAYPVKKLQALTSFGKSWVLKIWEK